MRYSDCQNRFVAWGLTSGRRFVFFNGRVTTAHAGGGIIGNKDYMPLAHNNAPTGERNESLSQKTIRRF